MGADPLPQILISIIALVFSGFFTVLKYSYENINEVKVNKMYEDDLIDKNKQQALLNCVDKSDDISVTFLTFDYLSNTFVGAYLAMLGFSYFNFRGVVIFLIIATILILIFGETVPSYIAIKSGDKIAVNFLSFTHIFVGIFSPLCKLIRKLSTAFGKIFAGSEGVTEPKITEDELYNAVNLSRDEGLLDSEEYGIIEKVFAFSDTFVKDVMIPRTEVVAIDIESSIGDIINCFNDEGYSRVPVYEDDIDNVLGILHVKDLLPYFADHKEINIRDVLRKPMYSFEFQKTSALFSQMRKTNSTFCIVLDEYGGTDGIVTMEDLIEEIVGEIEDEYDTDTELDSREVIPLKNNLFIVDGLMKLEDFNEHFHLDLESEEMETVGGYVIEAFDKIPKQGEILKRDNVEFEVVSLDKNRIAKLKVKIK